MTKLEGSGYEVLSSAIPKDAIDAATRLIYKDLFDFGISSREIVWWRDNACWFPHLRWKEPIMMLAKAIPLEYKSSKPCEPQIQLAPPDTAKEYELKPHIDKPPPWANGKQYRSSVGIPLTPHNSDDGGVQIWPFNGSPVIPNLMPGDILVMHPQLPHCSVPNLQGGPRLAVYFRFLEV